MLKNISAFLITGFILVTVFSFTRVNNRTGSLVNFEKHIIDTISNTPEIQLPKFIVVDVMVKKWMHLLTGGGNMASTRADLFKGIKTRLS